MLAGFSSDVGLARRNNEDKCFVNSDAGIFIVADGMGGHQSGEKAADLTVNIISQRLLKANIMRKPRAILDFLAKVINEANEAIFEAS